MSRNHLNSFTPLEATLGLIDIICSIVCFWPQIIKSIKTESVEDLSVTLCYLSIIAYVSAYGYALLRFGFDLLLCANYILSCASALVMVGVYYKFKE